MAQQVIRFTLHRCPQCGETFSHREAYFCDRGQGEGYCVCEVCFWSNLQDDV